MQPVLDIRTVHPGLFTYSLGAAEQPGQPCGHFFDTAERCLQDAGLGLSLYFDRVQISFAGFALGSYPVGRMVENPMELFDELLGRVMEIYRKRSAPRDARPAAHERSDSPTQSIGRDRD